MKFLRNLLLGVGALLALLVLAAFMLPDAYEVERRIHIKARPDQVYALIASPRQWKRWSTWNRRDPEMRLSYSGPETGAGASWQWDSRSQGRGEMTLVHAEPGQRVDYDLFFPDFDSRPRGSLSLRPDGEGTEVVWRMAGRSGLNPFMRWMNLFMDGIVGRDFEEGLGNLREVAEKP